MSRSSVRGSAGDQRGLQQFRRTEIRYSKLFFTVLGVTAVTAIVAVATCSREKRPVWTELSPGGYGQYGYWGYEDPDGAEGGPVPRILVVTSNMIGGGGRAGLNFNGISGNTPWTVRWKITGEGIHWNERLFPFSTSNLFFFDYDTLDQSDRVMTDAELDEITRECRDGEFLFPFGEIERAPSEDRDTRPWIKGK